MKSEQIQSEDLCFREHFFLGTNFCLLTSVPVCPYGNMVCLFISIYFLTDFVLFIFGFVLSFLVGWAENWCDIRLGSMIKKDLQIEVRDPKSLRIALSKPL